MTTSGDDQIAHFYTNPHQVPRSSIPKTSHRAHTMGSAVDAYAEQRVPGAPLSEMCERRLRRADDRQIDLSDGARAGARYRGAPHRVLCAPLRQDYLRRPVEREPAGIYNLTNHRVSGALQGKRRMLAEVARLLRQHYQREPLSRDRSLAVYV